MYLPRLRVIILIIIHSSETVVVQDVMRIVRPIRLCKLKQCVPAPTLMLHSPPVHCSSGPVLLDKGMLNSRIRHAHDCLAQIVKAVIQVLGVLMLNVIMLVRPVPIWRDFYFPSVECCSYCGLFSTIIN